MNGRGLSRRHVGKTLKGTRSTFANTQKLKRFAKLGECSVFLGPTAWEAITSGAAGIIASLLLLYFTLAYFTLLILLYSALLKAQGSFFIGILKP